MSASVVRFTPDHAAALADLFNDCRDMWPWDFTDGIPYTAEHLARLLGERGNLDLLLALVDGTPRGFLELSPYPSDGDAAYVQLIAVHPDHQGCGLGRRLLREAVETTARLGFSRLDLHTWPANLKAVPLYKKTGFFWVPGTQVWMQNYLPLLLAIAPCREFFGRHDWYRALERQTTIAPDDEQWHNMKVFTYNFLADDQRLKAVVDREARGVTALCVGDTEISCRVDGHLHPEGSGVAVTWAARSGNTVPLTARGEEHLRVSVDTSLEAGSSEITRQVAVLAGAAGPDEDRRAPRLESTFFVDGSTVVLHTGIRAHQPVKLVTNPDIPVLVPGRTSPLHLGVVNPGRERVGGRLHVAPCRGLSLTPSPASLDFDLGPWEREGFCLEVTAETVGTHSLAWWADIDFGDQQTQTPVRRLEVPCVGRDAVGFTRDGFTYLANRHLILKVWHRGGRFALLDRRSGIRLARGTTDFLGPPFFPGEFRNFAYEPDVEADTLVLEAGSERWPELRWIREMTLDEHTLLITNRHLYSAPEPLDLELHQIVIPEAENGVTTLPLAGGLVRERARAPEFPARHRDLTLDGDGWAETWTSYERDGTCVGVMWTDAREAGAETEIHVTRPLRIPPGEGAVEHPLAVYAGPGDWTTVRRLWSDRFAAGPRNLGPPAGVMRARWNGARVGAPLVPGPDGRAGLLLENLRGREAGGWLSLEVPEGWAVDPGGRHVDGVSATQPAALDVTLTVPGDLPGAGDVRAVLETDTSTTGFSLPVIFPGRGGEVKIDRDGDSYIVSNGLVRFRVAPSFFASMVSLQRDGVEHLLSPYPETGEFSWLKPWYGGLHPVLPTDPFPRPGSLAEEHPSVSQVSAEGSSGLIWRGLEVAFTLERAEELRGAGLRVRYMTLPGSNLVAVMMTVSNDTTAPLETSPSFVAFPAAPRGSRLLVGEAGGVVDRSPGAVEAWLTADGWSAVTSSSGALVLTCPEPFGVLDHRGESPLWGTMWDAPTRHLLPGGRVDMALHLAVTGSDEAERYRPLSMVDGLL